ncbi:MAG: class C sortase [Clostridia bacterium]|nr:class C sortase [Clostridia bacterium]
MKKTTIFLIIASVIGLTLLLYPSFSNLWNESHASRMIHTVAEQAENIETESYRNLWQEAIQYNEDLRRMKNPYMLTPEMKERYDRALDISGLGILGYIDIPSLGVTLPIYHGTDADVLQAAAGHIEWTSLPTGGEGTHCALSGHRGLPNAKLFTDLNKLREGDTFTLTVLGELLTYEVDQIRTVLPSELEDLRIEEGRDLCTLVTCTPYGINTHRLLVRGHRIANLTSAAVVLSDAVRIDQLIVAFYLAMPLLIFLYLKIMLTKPKKKRLPERSGEE